MIAIDTKILVRILIDDESIDQITIARNLAQKAKVLFIAQTVQVELVWVLKRAYGLPKSAILAILQELLVNEAFKLQHSKQFTEALQLYTENTADFADCLLLMQCKDNAVQRLYTFDRKFAKLEPVILLNETALAF